MKLDPRILLERIAGAALGGSLSALAFGVASMLGFSTTGSIVPDLRIVGIGVGIVLGFVEGPRAVRSTRPVVFAIAVAVKAVLLAVVVWLGVVVAVSASEPAATGDAGAAGIIWLVFVIPYAFIIGLPITVPVALAATTIMRAGAGRLRMLTVLTLAIVVSTPFVVAALDSRAQRDFDGHAFGDAVQLTWTIENRSSTELELGVWETDATSTGGWTRGIEGCFVTTGRDGEPAGWFLTLRPAPTPDEDWDAVPPPLLVSASAASGTTPSVWITVRADGTTIADPNRAPPAPEELTVDLCAEESP